MSIDSWKTHFKAHCHMDLSCRLQKNTAWALMRESWWVSVLADIKSQNKVKEIKRKPSKNKPIICMLGLNHSQPIRNNIHIYQIYRQICCSLLKKYYLQPNNLIWLETQSCWNLLIAILRCRQNCVCVEMKFNSICFHKNALVNFFHIGKLK